MGHIYLLTFKPKYQCEDNDYKVHMDKSIQCSHYKLVDLLKINEVLAKLAQPEKVNSELGVVKNTISIRFSFYL